METVKKEVHLFEWFLFDEEAESLEAELEAAELEANEDYYENS